MRHIYHLGLTWSTDGFQFQFTSKQEEVDSLTLDAFIEIDSEGPRGRTGRPEIPSSSANLSYRPSALSQVQSADEFTDDMCNPLASRRADVTKGAVPVAVPSKSGNPTVGLPSGVGENWKLQLPPPSVDKHNAFAQQKAKLDAQFPSSPFSHPHSPRRATSIPTLPSLPVSILKPSTGNISIAEVRPRSSSAPPSPPKMEGSSDFLGGNHKPLPMSPRMADPHTPSPRTPILKKDGMHHPTLANIDSSAASHRSSFATIKELPETVRTLQYQYEATQQRLATKIDDINRLEKKVGDFFTMTESYIKDQMHAQIERNSGMSFELSKVKREVKKTMDQVDQIKESIHEIQLEVNGLTSTVNDLSAKVDMSLAGIWENTEEPFVAYQRRRNSEMAEDIQDIGDLAVNNAAQNMFLRQSIIRMQIGYRLLQHENNLTVSQDVQLTLPPFPLPAEGSVPPTGQVQSRFTYEPEATPPASTTVPANVTRSASRTGPARATSSTLTTVPKQATLAKSTSSSSTTVRGKATSPASAAVSTKATIASSTSSTSTVVPAKATPAKSASSSSTTVRGKATPLAFAAVPVKTTPSASTAVPTKVTLPASVTGSATNPTPGPSTAKQSVIPRLSKDTRSNKSPGSQLSHKENIGKNNGGFPDIIPGSTKDFKAKKDAIDKQHGSEKKGKSFFGFRRRSDSLSSVASGKSKSPRSARQEESVPPVPPLPHGIVLPPVPGEPIPLGNIHPLYRSGFREVNALGIPAITPIVPPRPTQPKGSPESGKDETRK